MAQTQQQADAEKAAAEKAAADKATIANFEDGVRRVNDARALWPQAALPPHPGSKNSGR